MSDNVVRLIPNNALAIDPADLAECLRKFASYIEAGECGQVDRVCVVLDLDRGVDCRVYGRQCNRAEMIGLLEYAKSTIMRGVE